MNIKLNKMKLKTRDGKVQIQIFDEKRKSKNMSVYDTTKEEVFEIIQAALKLHVESVEKKTK